MGSEPDPKRERRLEWKINRLFILLLVTVILLIILAVVAIIIPPRPIQLWSSSVLALLISIGTVASLLSLHQGISWTNRGAVSIYLVGISFVSVLNVFALGILLWGLVDNSENLHLGISIPLFIALLVLLLLNIVNLVFAAQIRKTIPNYRRESGFSSGKSGTTPAAATAAYTRPMSMLQSVGGNNENKNDNGYSNPSMFSDKVFYSTYEQKVSTEPTGGGRYSANSGTNTSTSAVSYATNQQQQVDNNNFNRQSTTIMATAATDTLKSTNSYASAATTRVETLKPAGSQHSVLTMTSDL